MNCFVYNIRRMKKYDLKTSPRPIFPAVRGRYFGSGISFIFIFICFAASFLILGCKSDNGVTTPQVRVTAVSPNQIVAGKKEVEVQITGSGFTSASAVSLGADVSVLSFVVADASRIVITVDVSDEAAAGPRTVIVTTPTGSGQLPDGLEILQNRLPKISYAVDPATGNQGTVFTFDARGSSDPDGRVKSYLWDFGDGTESTKAVAKHTFTRSGRYTVTLTITDDAGFESSRSKTIKIVFDQEVARKQIDAVTKEFLRLYGQIETLSSDQIVVGFSTQHGCPGRNKEIGIIERNQAVGGSVEVNIFTDTQVSRVDETTADAALSARFTGRHPDGSIFDGIVTHYFQMQNEAEGWKICDFRVD